MSDKNNENELDAKTNEAVESDAVTDAAVEEAVKSAENEEAAEAVTEAEETTESATEAAESVNFSVIYDDADDADNANDVSAQSVESASVADTIEVAEDVSATEGESDADSTDGSDAANTNVPDESNGGVASENADRVNATLALGTPKENNPLQSRKTVKADSATSVSSQLDREIKRTKKKDAFFFKANPTFALNHVTVTDRKTGRNLLDDLSLAFHAGATHAVLVDEEDNEQHQTLLATMVGMIRPNSGNVTHKSAKLDELEPVEVLGHRIGFIPQQFAARKDLDAESNVLYAMNASNRNFLKPKPVIARELLQRVGFDEVTSGLPISKVNELNQRRVAIARAISCEAEVIIADEPTAGLNADDTQVVLELLRKLKRDNGRKRAIIVVTADPEVADAMEHSVELE
ncbi:ATP-binding cassette domain-containing protein [uncultured Bifidobacterium sp.]|uniref:ATP-binding cassette domain-containing protein n=2 Tax=Bifidobacterium TaxID=1678 RepID=UPI00260AAA22|nr:ATP-binding cassette domain-containing protein [uncultured Bifidobacterium sp.]